MQHKLKNHELVKTEDGTYTVYSKVYNENAHSLHGASNETELHYIKGCKIDEKINKYKLINILEVGFGAGIGFLKTFENFKDSKINMTSLEIDEELIHLFNEENPSLMLNKTEKNIYQFRYNNFHLEVYIGDARERIKEIDKKFHAIYQDAYSPRRNPRLWTVEWFEELKLRSHKDITLSTYSASSSIRKSMLQAGFSIYTGEKFGQKRTSTRACLNRESDYDIIKHLNRSPASAITDATADDYRKRF